MKKIFAFTMAFAMLIFMLASCAGSVESNTTTQTTATTAGITEPQVVKITNKAEYHVLEVFGYDLLRAGKTANDVLAGELPLEKTDIVLDENGEINAETLAKILQEYNVDMEEFTLAPVKAAIDARNEYNYSDLPGFEQEKCKIAFREISDGKFAIEYQINFWITPLNPEYEGQRLYDFRHLLVYLN